MAKSKFSGTRKPRKKRTPKPRTGGGRKGGNAWRAYVGGGRGHTVSNAPLPD
jgi:hypothetical protein